MVRLALVSASSFALASAVAGCGNNTPPRVYAVSDWQVRCDSMMVGCTAPLPRRIDGFNESGRTVSCNAVETATERTINFSVGGSEGGVRYQVDLVNARVPRAGGSPATGCQLTVTEGASTFRGPCGGSAVSTSQPCNVTVAFSAEEATGSPIVDVGIVCDHLPNTVAPEQLRGLSLPGSESTAPASFRFFDCRGISRM